MSTTIVRLGLVGAGRWGRHYIRTIAHLDDMTLYGVASRNPETAALISPECRIFADWRALATSPEVDGIVIASPPATHANILIAALEAGKAVLVEKPLVVARAQLPAILDAAAHTSATIMVEHTHLFHPAFRALKVAAERLGSLRAVRSSAGAKGPYRRDVSVLWDWAPHDVAMVLDLMPGGQEVVEASVLLRQDVDGFVAERLRLRLKLAGEIPCQIMLSTLGHRHRWFAVDFEDRTLIYTDGAEPLRLIRRRGAEINEASECLPIVPDMPLTVAVREFAAAIRSGDSGRDSFALGCQVVDVIARCEEMMGDRSACPR